MGPCGPYIHTYMRVALPDGPAIPCEFCREDLGARVLQCENCEVYACDECGLGWLMRRRTDGIEMMEGEEDRRPNGCG